MLEIKIDSNIKAVQQQLNRLSDDLRGKALARAINRTTDSARAMAARLIRDAGYGLQVTVIKERIGVIRATPKNPVAILRLSGRPIPLIAYSARQAPRKAGVNVKVLNGAKNLPYAFMATMKSGHRGVFTRKSGTQMGKRGQPILNRKIEERFGPSIANAGNNERVRKALQAKLSESLAKNLQAEIAYRLSKAGSRTAAKKQ